MYADACHLALLLAALTATTAQTAGEQVFEPGTKHVCVPAANGDGWDCRSADGSPVTAADDGKDRPREPRLRSSSQVPDEIPASDATAAQVPAGTPAAAPPAPQSPPPSVAAPRANPRNVPHYLLAPEARATAVSAPPAEPAPPARPAPVAETPATAPRERAPVAASSEPAPEAPAATAPPPAPPVAAAPERSAPAAPAAAPPPAEPPRSPAADVPPVAATPAPTPAAPPPAANGLLLGATEFRRLGDSRYVIELASGSSRDAVEREAAAPAHGEVYLLPLQRDGAAWYVAVWGDFDSVDAARSARAEALANGATRLGWPRRVGPLKQELGR